MTNPCAGNLVGMQRFYSRTDTHKRKEKEKEKEKEKSNHNLGKNESGGVSMSRPLS